MIRITSRFSLHPLVASVLPPSCFRMSALNNERYISTIGTLSLILFFGNCLRYCLLSQEWPVADATDHLLIQYKEFILSYASKTPAYKLYTIKNAAAIII